MQTDQDILNQFNQQNPWGLYTSVDLKNCNPQFIRDHQKIKQFVDQLCNLIEMKKFGLTHIVDFGEDPRVTGFSMTQLIETSLISGHFANQTDAAYLDIFSCKYYPPFKAAEFAKQFFEAKQLVVQVNFRK